MSISNGDLAYNNIETTRILLLLGFYLIWQL